MPKSNVEASRNIEVLGYVLTLTIDKRWSKPGDTVNFKGRLTADGVGQYYQLIELYIVLPGGPVKIGDEYTDENGDYIITWIVPRTVDTQNLPCVDWSFYALHPKSGTKSDTKKMAVAYPTRIRDLTAPSQVAPGEVFAVEGYLEYEEYPGVWSPISGAEVILFYDTTELSRGATDLTGYFKLAGAIGASGSYVLRVVYQGENLPTLLAPTIAGIPIYVPGVEASLIGALAPVLTIIGIVGLNEVRKYAKI